MSSINLQKELTVLLPTIKGKSLLLHSCCAPCSSYVLEYLANYLNITVYYYNPNIAPPTEYYRRLAEQEELLSKLELPYKIKFVEGEYVPDDFFVAIKGFESAHEGGERCSICFRLRLEEAAKKAKELGLDYFATTLSISPHKSSQLLHQISTEVADKHKIPHLPSDFKKNGGYQRSLELSKKYGLYRQNYCGCAFSIRETNQ